MTDSTQRTLAFIPARGGSKGIPHKNIVRLAGKPLIQYSINAAEQSADVDDILVSSDCDEILRIAASCGVTTDYRRPPELAADGSTVVDGVKHALDWLAERGDSYTHVIVLQPTSPLRTSTDIDNAFAQFQEQSADSLFAVHEMREHPYECISYQADDWSYLSKPNAATRRQDYAKGFYFINGAIYICTVEHLQRTGNLVDANTVPFVMPRRRGLDIDEPEDLKWAEFILTQGGKTVCT